MCLLLCKIVTGREVLPVNLCSSHLFYSFSTPIDHPKYLVYQITLLNQSICLRFSVLCHFIDGHIWNAKLTETQIFSELSIKIESSLIELKSSLIQLKSSLIQLESSLIQLESSLIQLESSLYMYN